MNRFVLSIVLGLFTFFSSWAQNETVVLNYVSDLPFQTSNDSEYYHLESSLLLRKITKDVLEFVEAEKMNKKDLKFIVTLKNNRGAALPIQYLVKSPFPNSNDSKTLFSERTYNWFNRTFRSQIPY